MPLIPKESPTLQEFFKTFKQRFMSIKIGEPNRQMCNWVVGLTDNEEQFKNSFKCTSTSDAEALLNFMLSENYTNITQGENFGSVSLRNVVYLVAVDR